MLLLTTNEKDYSSVLQNHPIQCALYANSPDTQPEYTICSNSKEESFVMLNAKENPGREGGEGMRQK